jgi:hypothetical protein
MTTAPRQSWNRMYCITWDVWPASQQCHSVTASGLEPGRRFSPKTYRVINATYRFPWSSSLAYSNGSSTVDRKKPPDEALTPCHAPDSVAMFVYSTINRSRSTLLRMETQRNCDRSRVLYVSSLSFWQKQGSMSVLRWALSGAGPGNTSDRDTKGYGRAFTGYV